MLDVGQQGLGPGEEGVRDRGVADLPGLVQGVGREDGPRLGRDGQVDAGREAAEGVVVVVGRHPELAEVVGAFDAGGRLADLLHRGHEEPDEHGDDGDDDQQLDQREPRTAIHKNLLMIAQSVLKTLLRACWRG